MFESLSDKLQSVFQRLRGKGRVSEADVNEAMREVRLALLEADVSFQVVKDFVGRVREKAVGVEVLESLSPAQQVVKIVNDELIALLGGEQAPLNMAATPPTVIMLCGLQGTGKTTLCGKLALWFKKQGRNPLMVACDIYRPAAIKQLQVLGAQIAIPVFTLPPEQQKAPPTIARAAIQQAAQNGNDIVLLDTAGRLHIDSDLMDELGQMKAYVQPHEMLLVVDAMVGQDAVNFAQEFNSQLAITGFVMTKMDGDTRGGAALSIRAVTGVPIKFLGVGEKLDALEPFYPDRLASRILGMGDILSLIEKAQEAVDEKKAQELEKKLRESRFDLNDFLEQMQSMKKLGPLENIMKMLPGMNSAMLDNVQIDPKLLARKEAIVQAMTPAERTNPGILNGSRRKRIAAGCGQSVQEINQFLSEFEQMRKMIHTMMAQAPGGKPGKLTPVGAMRALKKMPKGGRGKWFRR
ncbi:MAG TPA: signal recognition particle protein [Chthonomonadaceae bacterium]|nr:signal recognition particle protein [Chthonomonadaceae bacterium]